MKKKILSLSFIILVIFAIISPVNAISYGEADESVNQTGKYDSVRLIAGNRVTSNADIDGISFVAGNDVSVNGRTTYGFYAGNSVTINEAVEKDLFVAGNSVTIGNDAVIGRDIFIAASNILVSSNVARNLFAGGSTVNISGITINGDAHIEAERIIMDESTVIKGKLTYEEGATVTGLESATIGSIKTTKIATNDNVIKYNPVNYFYSFVISIISSFIVLAILFYLLPKTKDKLLNTKLDASNIGMSIAIGILTVIVLPIIAIIALLTGILTPLALIALCVFIIACYLSTLFASFIIGNLINTKLFKNNSIYLSILIGLILIKLIGLIPVLGFIISILLFLYGLGLIALGIIKVKDEK